MPGVTACNRAWTAASWILFLVLDVNRRGAGVFEGAHHVHDVERLAIARVAVD